MAPIELENKAEEELQNGGDHNKRLPCGSPEKIVPAATLKPSEKPVGPKENGSYDDVASASDLLSETQTPCMSPRRVRRERLWSGSAKDDSLLLTRQRTIYTAGRPPWYDVQGQLVEPFVIGICGGSASGKTTVARKIIEALNVPWVTLLSMDSFYKVLDEEQHRLADENQFNFDHPDAFDFDLLIETLKKLKEGKRVEVPIYNFVTHAREKRFKFMYGANVIIFEGILCFANKELLSMMDMKIFIDTDSDIRLARRLQRDITERGRDLEGCLAQYERFVKPAFDHYIAPSMVHADLIVPRGGDNHIAINLIVQHVHTQLVSRGLKLRSKMAESHTDQPLPASLHLLPQTPQLRGIHTFIRNRATQRDEFIFYSKRLMRLLMEYTVAQLPFQDATVETPQGISYNGKRSAAGKICGVSILRAGETMEQALCDVLKDVRLGKILIQTNQSTGEPELYYLRLPKDIKDYTILLMDATVATGAASIMAVRVLLDHDVPEENIMLVSLLMAESGVHSVAYAFPKVRIITTAVDPVVTEKFYIEPGIGNFGDRYFGTEALEYL
ncbi:uridine-cytidine kinase-like 1 isoform X1 [Rhipicephalus sanguineus]|uniref:uridine-cytidine kinase-like 1 isoform X1 n=1 Tax=Rhipicephalus sanguineus TaxID=34632 RepID=UPI001894145E|nr:uridine-cytidine kinase-like 1 isoform X1 [Rhipicephalus sanguineus]